MVSKGLLIKIRDNFNPIKAKKIPTPIRGKNIILFPKYEVENVKKRILGIKELEYLLLPIVRSLYLQVITET
jgi:hypothetical protein